MIRILGRISGKISGKISDRTLGGASDGRPGGIRMAIVGFAAIATIVASPGASAASYAVMTGVKGVVTLYDLSGVERTATGFRIASVAVSDHWPKSFGPLAYRLSREDYDCGTGRYDIALVRDVDRAGTVLTEIHSSDRGAMERVPATASTEMFNRFCPDAGAHLPGLTPRETVEQDTPAAAAGYAQTLLDSGAR